MKTLALVLSVLGLFWVTAPAEAATLSTRDVAGWQVGAYSNDQTGQFSHCTAGVPYVSGIYMMFAVDKNFQWGLWFFNNAWNLQPQNDSWHLLFMRDDVGIA